jgi:hypothetical protein
MRIRLLLLAALLLAAVPATVGAAQLTAPRDPYQLTGIVERVYAGDTLLVRADDDRLYDVRARGVPVQLTGGDVGRWDDLRIGQEVEVYGDRRDDRRIDARLIRLTGMYDPDRLSRIRDDDRYRDDRYRSDWTVDVSGTVFSIDPDRESFRLRTARGLRTVEVFDETRLTFGSGGSARFRDVRVGDAMRVSGVERQERIVAEHITLLEPSTARYRYEEPYDDRLGRDDAVVVGTVRAPTYGMNRRVKVRTARGDVTVDADRDVSIVKYDDRVSIHELNRGDRVRVVGTWTGPDRIRAHRISVDPPPPPVRQETLGYRSDLPHEPMPVVTVIGFLVSHDEDRDRMRLSTRDGDRIIVANGTPAFVRGERISRRNIRQGDRVRATGYWNGREILATRVELAY